ncbi:isoprenylcysteine carboxylmethyltransferase family protein [Henriciella sp. AS95]|uniref:methyltransferase family protein n=1 Tax=Henriciella sp. AS95 TaxID=3135782 RepID=UPI00317E5A96
MKIPPPLVFAVPILIGWAVEHLVPASVFTFPFQPFVGLIALICAAVLLILAVTGFRLKKTTVNPFDPSEATALVSGGIYSFSRNPMYVGMALFALGICLGQGWSAGLLLLPVAIWYIDANQIKPEEAALRERFGAEYDAYCKRVRRWV